MLSLRKISAAIALIAAPVLATAQDYQLEVSAQYLNLEVESYDFDAIAVEGTYYWQKVTSAGHPFAEAAFLARQGGLTVGYADVDEADAWSLAADHYLANGLYLAGRYGSPDEGDDTWGASVGYSPFAGLLFVLDADDDSEDINYTGRVKYVAALQGERAYGLEASLVEETLAVSGDYFFNRRFSLGAELVDDGDADLTLASVNAKYFIAPTFWVAASVGSNLGGDYDATLWGVEAGLRF